MDLELTIEEAEALRDLLHDVANAGNENAEIRAVRMRVNDLLARVDRPMREEVAGGGVLDRGSTEAHEPYVEHS